MAKFAPIHIISGYSFLQSGLSMEKIEKGIKSNSYFGAGLTDNNALFGLPEFVHTMDSLKLPYILGINLVIEGYNISLYCINDEGYKNLIQIINLQNSGELSFSLIKLYCKSLIAVFETKYGKFYNELFNENISTSFIKELAGITSSFLDNVYLGIEVSSREEIVFAKKVREFANKYTYKTVAFPRVQYLKKEDAIVLDIVDAIAENTKIDIKKKEGNAYFLKEEDYHKIYTEEEIENTSNIISSSSFKLIEKRGEMLSFSNNSEQELRDMSFNKLKELNLEDQKHIDRLNYELETIISMGYADYFLIVSDYVNWAKNNGILVGPGRGSAAGSLVSHLLGISEVDPLDYDLLFERFLNPARKSMPDIDVDFMDIYRDDVIEYARQKYGNDRVSSIVSFQTIKSKQALRDIGRIYDFPERHIVLLSKKLTNKDISLTKSYFHVPDFKALVDSDKYFQEIVSLASKIEGLPRQTGQHASGVVLNNTPIKDNLPTSLDTFGHYVTQYESNYLEEQGFLKMDFLALRNLTTVSRTVDLINERHPEVKISKQNIPFNEQEVFDLIRDCNTIGLFQIDTVAMKRDIKVLKPKCFDDVVALVALNRPATMSNIKVYANRRDGKEKVTYLSNCLEEILKPTYGIIVYQEQVNKTAITMAGFSKEDADVFRSAISKKKKEVFDAMKAKFFEGSLKNGHTKKETEDVFAAIEKFSGYGLNKSHSVVYAVLACKMAYLKAHYPLEFYTALLENESTNDTKFADFVNEIRKVGIKVLAPNVNTSTSRFSIYENSLLLPLTCIKEINFMLSEAIIKERSNKPFEDIFDFTTRMLQYHLTDKQLTYLISAGAFDSLHSSRASLILSSTIAMQFAKLLYSENGQLSIGINESMKPQLFKAEDKPLDNLDNELDALGIMLSANPLSYKKELLDKKGVIQINELVDKKNELICGIIRDKKVINTKKNESMSFIKIFDASGDIEVVAFPKIYTECYTFLEKNRIILVKGHLEIKDDGNAFIADEISLLDEGESNEENNNN